MTATYQTHQRDSLFAIALLVFALLQGSSFSLSIAFREPFASDTLISLVTMLWLAMYAFSTVGLFASFGVNWITWMVRYRLLLTFLLAGTAFSISWSVDTALSVERTVHLIGTTLVALYIGFSLSLNRILRTSALVLGFIMLTSVAAALYLPELGLEDYEGNLVWAGTLASKNTLGFWAAITLLLGVSLSLWTIPFSQRLFYIAISALSLLCLYNSVSATSLLAVITAGLIMVYLHVALSLRMNIVAMLVLGCLVAGLVGLAFYFIDTAELIGRSGDLTGRGDVWLQTWQLILERPLTGFGYGTLWYPTADSLWIQQSLTDFSWTVFHAHNGLLQIASEIGLPLTALALLMILQQLVEVTYCQYKRQQPGVLFVLGFIIALLVSNYSEARLLVNRELYWIFFVALPVSMLQQVTLMVANQEYSPATGQILPGGPNNLRDALERKEKKKHTKERLKHLAGLRVINPTDASAQTSAYLANSASTLAQPADSTSNQQLPFITATPKPVVAVKSSRIATKSAATRLKKIRRQDNTG